MRDPKLNSAQRALKHFMLQSQSNQKTPPSFEMSADVEKKLLLEAEKTMSVIQGVNYPHKTQMAFEIVDEWTDSDDLKLRLTILLRCLKSPYNENDARTLLRAINQSLSDLFDPCILLEQIKNPSPYFVINRNLPHMQDKRPFAIRVAAAVIHTVTQQLRDNHLDLLYPVQITGITAQALFCIYNQNKAYDDVAGESCLHNLTVRLSTPYALASDEAIHNLLVLANNNTSIQLNPDYYELYFMLLLLQPAKIDFDLLDKIGLLYRVISFGQKKHASPKHLQTPSPCPYSLTDITIAYKTLTDVLSNSDLSLNNIEQLKKHFETLSAKDRTQAPPPYWKVRKVIYEQSLERSINTFKEAVNSLKELVADSIKLQNRINQIGSFSGFWTRRNCFGLRNTGAEKRRQFQKIESALFAAAEYIENIETIYNKLIKDNTDAVDVLDALDTPIDNLTKQIQELYQENYKDTFGPARRAEYRLTLQRHVLNLLTEFKRTITYGGCSYNNATIEKLTTAINAVNYPYRHQQSDDNPQTLLLPGRY